MTNSKFDRYDEYRDSETEWLNNIPQHWKSIRIKDVSFLQSGKNIVSEQIEGKGLYPVYGGNGLRGYYNEYTNSGNYILIGRQGALCGNINYASEKFWASEHAVVVYLKRSINIKWYGEMLRVMNLNQYSLSAAQPGLAVDRIKRLLFPIPPLPEQTKISNYLDKKTAQIDRKIDLLTQKADRYKELKQSLINETVTRGLNKSVPLKNSGVEWIGKIPEHWEVKRLKDIAISTNGGAFKDDICDSGLPIVKIQQLKSNKEVLEFCNPNSVKIKPSNKIRKGDLVFSWSTLIEPFIYKGPEAVLNQHIFKIDKKKDVSKLWLFYKILQSTDRLMIFAHGSTMKHILKSDFDNLEIETPNYKEQKQIANYLDKKTAQIDKITETINTQIEKLKELRKTLINDVVTGKIKVYKEDAA